MEYTGKVMVISCGDGECQFASKCLGKWHKTTALPSGKNKLAELSFEVTDEEVYCRIYKDEYNDYTFELAEPKEPTHDD